MKSTTPQPAFARGSDSGSFVAESALSFSKRVQQQPKVTHLVLRDESGQATQRWPLAHTKSTIGSSDSCSIVCKLPGIESLNAIVVNGAKQTFVRGLSPNLSQDGVATNELLLTETKSNFELAGHRFELIRQADRPSSTVLPPARLRFTSARPFEANRPSTASRYAPQAEPNLPSDLADAPWLRGLIQRTIEPLEAQISSLLTPVQEYQTQVLQAQQLQSNQTNQEQQRQAALTQEISSIVAKQSATMESLGERLRDVNQQLDTIERIIAEDSELESKAKDGLSQDVGVQRVAIDQLQTGMVAVSESLNQLHDRQHTMQDEYQGWKEEIQARLDNLSQVVSDIKECTKHRADSEILSAVQSLQQSQLLAQEEVQRWQYGLHDQIEALEKKISEITSISAVSPSHDPSSLAESIQVAEQAAVDSVELKSDTEDHPPSNNDWLDQWTTIQPSDTSEDSTGSIGSTLDEPVLEFISDAGLQEPDCESIETGEEATEQSILPVEEPEFAINDTPIDPGHAIIDHIQAAAEPESHDLVWDDALESIDSDVDYAPTILTDSSRLASQYQADSSDDLENLQGPRNLLEWESDSTGEQDSNLDVDATAGIPTGDSSLSEASNSSNQLAAQEVAATDSEADFYFGSTQLDTPQENSLEAESLYERAGLDESSSGASDSLYPTDNEPESNSAEGKPAALPSWWMDDELEDTELSAMESQLDVVPVNGSPHANATDKDIDLTKNDSRESQLDSESQFQADLHSPDGDDFAASDGDLPAVEVQQIDPSRSASSDFESDKGDEASVEQYMRDLLTRMRGSQSEVAEIATARSQVASVSKPDSSHIANPSESDEQSDVDDPENAFDSDNYISLTNAPEKSKNIHALRDLANNSARQAIRKSTRQKYISTSLLKLAICVIALTVSGVLFSINGLDLNIGLVATFASLLVAAIWGYDAISGLRPLLRSSLVLAPPQASDNSDSQEE